MTYDQLQCSGGPARIPPESSVTGDLASHRPHGEAMPALRRRLRTGLARLVSAQAPVCFANAGLGSAAVCVPTGATASFGFARAQRLRVDAGIAWITLGEGDASRGDAATRQGDWFLSAGDWLVAEPGQRVVVEALGAEPLRLGFAAPGSAQ